MRNYLRDTAHLIQSCLPDGTSIPQRADELFLIYAVLLLAKGTETQASDVHDAWCAWMTVEDPSHESIRPYCTLDGETQAQDAPFLAAIREAVRIIDSRYTSDVKTIGK